MPSTIHHLTLRVIVVWTVSVLFSYLTSITSLILNVINSQENFLSILTDVPSVGCKIFNNGFKRKIYIVRRTSIASQLMVLLLLFGTSSACTFYSISEITFLSFVHFTIKELNAVINTVMTLQYISLVLILKQVQTFKLHAFRTTHYSRDFRL
jgi:hypothetical protein